MANSDDFSKTPDQLLNEAADKLAAATAELRSQISEVRAMLAEEYLRRLDTWWADLVDEDRRTFLLHRDDNPVPPDVIERLRASKLTIVLGSGSQQDSQFRWPAALHLFLQIKAVEPS